MRIKKYVSIFARLDRYKKREKKIEKVMNWVYNHPKELYKLIAMMNPDLMTVEIDGKIYGGKKNIFEKISKGGQND